MTPAPEILTTNDLLLILLSVVCSALASFVLWYLAAFRRETREAIHGLRGEMNCIKIDMAVVKSRMHFNNK